MSASFSNSPPEATDITCIAPEPFEARPLIADIVRTRYCIPGSIFLVEGVDTVHTSTSRRWRVIRLLLGDGELCIQALLSAEMHRFVDRGEVVFGSYIKLERFRVESKDVASDGTSYSTGTNDSGKGKGKENHSSPQHGGNSLVYLVVEDLVLVGWNNSLIDIATPENAQDSTQALHTEVKARPVSPPVPSTSPKTYGPQTANGDAIVPEEATGANDDFEVMPITTEKATQNRIDLAAKAEIQASTARPNSGYLPWTSNDLTKPLKLTKLRSIPNLPYKQNWSVNVLAVISAISGVEPSGLPPYRQRQARLADPSTDKHVLLTVFLDPEQFAPSVGSVVLLLGVKNHRFDGGSLKKYESDRPQAGRSWWYENPTEFSWCDVDGLKRWKDGTLSL
ncbi:hypothetical protein F4779DRAFT_187387 [Xylariaceae sp. FL0662B]|nr:hypothetical protein F4779DRAFT_187387 [Xylariaceae sp. FL0662B]